MNKQKRSSVWWSILLIGIYLWIQVVTSIIFTVVYMLTDMFRTGQTEPFTFDRFIQNFMGERLLTILFISSILSLIICLFIYRWRKIKNYSHMKLNSTSSGFLLLAIPTGLAVEFTAMIIFALTASVFKQSADAYESMVSGLTTSVFAFITIGIVAPIVEDLIFRGMILNELRRNYSVTAAIIIQAVLFGFMHLNIAQAVYATFAGLILGMIAVAANSVWPAVIGHIIMNSSALLLSYLDEEKVNALLIPVVALSFVFLFITCRKLIVKIKNMNMSTEEQPDVFI